jgi:hemolysin activation/secretion protein
MKKYILLSAITVTLTYSTNIPSAANILQSVQAPKLPKEQKSLPVINKHVSTSRSEPKNSVRILIKKFDIKGNTAFSVKTLQNLIKKYEDKKSTLQELKQAVKVITNYYHTHGYFVAHAYMPAQNIDNYTLTIRVVEGKYESLNLHNSSLVKSSFLQGYIDILHKENIISLKPLNRQMLLINDLQGAKIISANFHPGKKTGTSSIDFNTEATKRFQGYIAGDNYGSIYTGQNRVRAGVSINSPAGYGDILGINALSSTTGGIKNAGLSYSIPLGYNGLKANISGAMTKYTLQDTLSSLNSYGYINQFTAGFSYPLIRQEKNSLYIKGDFTYTGLSDYINQTNSKTHVNGFKLSLNYNHEGKLLEKPLGFNSSITATRGDVILDNQTAVTNDAIRNTAGNFTKMALNTDAKIYLTNKLSLYVLFNAQKSFNKNSNSSEQFSAGGPSGVRAYGYDELSGDDGVLLTMQSDYALPAYKSLYSTIGVFYDRAKVWKNSVLYAGVINNTRELSNIGISYKASYKMLNISASLSHGIGNDATSVVDPTSNNNKFFIPFKNLCQIR